MAATDISGQLYAQGFAGLSAGLGRGLDKFHDKQEEEKKIKAMGNTAKQSLELFGPSMGLTEEQIKQMTTKSVDETDRQYGQRVYELFGNTLTAQKMKAMKQEMEARQVEIDRAKQERAQEDATRQRLQGYQQFQTPTTVAAPPSQQLQTLNGPSGAGPGAAWQFLKEQQGQGTVPSNAGAGVLRPEVQQRMQQELQTNPMLQKALQVLQATGQVPKTGELMAADSSAQALQARMLATYGKPTGKADIVEQGLPSGAKVAFSPSTGAFSVLPQTPQDIAKAEAAKSEADLTTKSANAFLDDVTTGAESGRKMISQVDRIIQLYGEGAKSGFAQPVMTQMQSALGRMGFGRKELATQQELEKELNQVAMEFRREIMKGTGQVSDYESKAVERAVANISNIPEANVKILTVLRNIQERAVKLDTLKMQLEDSGMSQVEIAKRLRKERANIPIGIDLLAVTPTKPTAATDSPADKILRKNGLL